MDASLQPLAEVYPERLPCRQSRGWHDARRRGRAQQRKSPGAEPRGFYPVAMRTAYLAGAASLPPSAGAAALSAAPPSAAGAAASAGTAGIGRGELLCWLR